MAAGADAGAQWRAVPSSAKPLGQGRLLLPAPDLAATLTPIGAQAFAHAAGRRALSAPRHGRGWGIAWEWETDKTSGVGKNGKAIKAEEMSAALCRQLV